MMMFFDDARDRNRLLILGLYETAWIVANHADIVHHYRYSFNDVIVKFYNGIVGNE